MKKCLHCNIEIDGARSSCPICQNSLVGEPSEYNWPGIKPTAKKYAYFYKSQLTFVLALCVIALGLDFLLNITIPGVRYSLIITGWAIAIEASVRLFIRRHTFPAKVISISAVLLSVLSALTAYYLGFFIPVFYIAIPVVIGSSIIANFVFAFIDKTGNTLVYLLCTILVGIIPYIVVKINDTVSLLLPWTIVLMISVVLFIGLIVFKGRNVLTEIQKRFNF